MPTASNARAHTPRGGANDAQPPSSAPSTPSLPTPPSTPSRPTWVSDVVMFVLMLVYQPIYNTILTAILPAYSEEKRIEAYGHLGLEPGATPEDIKASSVTLKKQYHPDKGGDEARFKEVNEASQVLSGRPPLTLHNASEAIANTLTVFIMMTILRIPPFCYILGGSIPLMNPIMISLLGYDWAETLSSALSGFIFAFARTEFHQFLIPVFLLRSPLTAAMWVTWAINEAAYLPKELIKYCCGDWGAIPFQFILDWVVVFPPWFALKVVSYWPWYFVPINLLWNLRTEICTYVRERKRLNRV